MHFKLESFYTTHIFFSNIHLQEQMIDISMTASVTSEVSSFVVMNKLICTEINNPCFTRSYILYILMKRAIEFACSMYIAAECLSHIENVQIVYMILVNLPSSSGWRRFKDKAMKPFVCLL